MSTPASGPPSAIDRENPWPGLASFTEDARGFFFGREKETDELLRLVRRQTLTVLFGQSGLGKSSLLQAGVFPLLREADFLPLYLRLDHGFDVARASRPCSDHGQDAHATLADQVKAALVAAFAREKADAPAPRADETLWEYFHRKDIDIWSAKNRLLTPVLAFDQFEEIFTLGRADETARARSRAFLIELACLVENRAPPAVQEKLNHGELDPARFNHDKPSCQVILSLREDFLPDLEGLKQEMPALIHNRLRLKKLSGTQALEIVTKPAPQLIAEGVAEKIVEFVAGARGGSAERLAELDVEPPLLSVICRELNDRRRTLGQAQITADLVSGNRREILTDFYERSVADLPAPMRMFIEDHLLTKSGFRDNLALETALEFSGVTRPLIDTLVARRLLRLEARLGVQRVELTHDVLADVVRASRDTRQQRQALDDAREKERLALATAARAARRQRWIIAGLATAVAGLCIGAFFGIRAQRNATHQAGRADFTLGSRLLDEGKLADGLAYLVSAGRKDPANPLIAPRILTSLTAHNFTLPVGSPLTLPSAGLGAGYSADGRWIFVQTTDDVLRMIDAKEWKLDREIKFDQKIRRFGVRAPEKNSEIFAVALADNTLLICDTATGRPRVPPIVPPDRIHGRVPVFGLSPDGRWLAATGRTHAWVWDTSSGELRATLPNDHSAWHEITFSPDSRRIVTTHGKAVTQMWSVPDGTPVAKPIENDPARYGVSTRFSGDGRRLLMMNETGAVICDADTGTLLRPLLPLGAWWEVFLNPDGHQLVLINASVATVLDVATGNPVFPPLVHDGPIYESRLSADGKILFTNSIDGFFRLWDMQTGKLLMEPTFRQSQFAPAAFSPDGKTVVICSDSGAVYQMRLGPGPAQPLLLPRDTTVAMVNLTMAAPTRLFWLTTTRARIFDAASGRETSDGFALPESIPGTGSIRSTYGTKAGAGLTLVVPTLPAGKPRTWRAWTVGDGGITRDVVLTDVPEAVTAFTLNPKGQIAAATAGGGNTIGLWNLLTGRLMTTIKTVGQINVFNAIISPDEKRVAFREEDAETRRVHVCDVASGKELSVVEVSGKAAIFSVRFTPDSARLITGDDWGGVQMWDAATGQLQKSTQAHRAVVRRIDFSDDGRYFATASQDGSVQAWESATGAPVGPPLLHKGSASKPDFSPDNARIVTQSSSGVVRVWDVTSGEPLTGMLDHEGATMNIAAYGPDGRFLQTFATSVDGKRTVRLWAAPPDGKGAPTPAWLLRLATVCAGRHLTNESKLVSATDDIAKIENLRREIAALPDDAPYVEWARWFLSESPTRPIAPGFTVTPAEAKKLTEEMAKSSAAVATTPTPNP
jgi:WD40 repeat protein